MEKLNGIVQTEPREDAGTIAFTLLLENGSLIPCRSGPGYKSLKPRKGDKVAVIGDTRRVLINVDLATRAKSENTESLEFFYNQLDVRTPAVEPAAV